MKEKISKTETIKKRAVYVYLPSEKLVKDWKDRANKYGISISKFVIEHVENSLRKEKGDSSVSRVKLIKGIKELEEENKKIKEDNDMLRIVVERLNEEVKTYRKEKFLKPEFEGYREFEKNLIDILKKKRQITSEELILSLNIEPKDTDSIQGLIKELELLEKFGLIKPTHKGWRWIG